MVQGYVSDVPGDDTVMETPTVTVTIDVSSLPVEQALAIINETDPSEQEQWVLGALMQGNDDVMDELRDVEFHLPLGPALTALDHIGVVDLPEEPPTDANEAVTEEQV